MSAVVAQAPPGVNAGAISIREVGKSYGEGKGRVVALERCSFEIAPGEFRVIVGPSGCGKTTLLGAIAGFHPITEGEIRLDGELLCGPGVPQARPGGDRVVVFQHSTLFPWMTVLDNVTYGPVVQGRMTRDEARERARDQLAAAGLVGYEDLYPGELSSGVARRVEIVRALVNEPRVLLLDEPFRGMDSITKSVMQQGLLELYDRSRVTVFFITHDIEEAVFLGSRVSVMSTRPGRVQATIDVDIPRPREVGVLTSPCFRELVGQVSELVRDEARRAFEAGERELA
ncbi:MAG TPA: ABC transporter ATP-binding protein [Solirubrobacterales bacterium]|jgi:NitT/TauT family transport system ATP-binding protein